MADILSPGFAGSFYPSDAGELAGTVGKFLRCGCTPADRAVGIVVPHAGYVYSGKTAGYGFASAPDTVSTVVVCAPSHRFPVSGGAVFDLDGIETPLGICPVNREVTGRLKVCLESIAFHEHSFEVMVPFIQVRWPEASVVPIILGMSPDCSMIAGMVHRFAPDSLFVASSDLSHYHPLKTAGLLDGRVIDGFLSLSPDEFLKSLAEGGEACGRHTILTLLHLAGLKNARRAVKLHYSTSADAGAGSQEVVGYFSGMVL